MQLTRRRTHATAVAAAAAAVVLAGCGTASTNADPTTSAPSSPTPVVSSIQPGPATSTPAPTSTPTSEQPTAPALPEPTQAREADTDTPTESPSESESESPSSTSTESGTGTASPSATSSPSATTTDDGAAGQGSGADSSATDGETMSIGSTGPRVLAAQKKLAQQLFGVGSPDGTFGGGTRQAVWSLQKVAGLPRTGELDAATLAALNRGVRGKPTISTGLEIDLGKQVMYVVRGGTLVRTLNISSGTGETFKYPVKDPKTKKVLRYETATATTSRGSYSIYMERNYDHKSTLELGSMYRPKYFDGAIAIHGSGNVPPAPASHGCVRVSNAAMDWLWTSGLAGKGARVVSY